MNCYVFITLEWAISIYIHRGSTYMEVTTALSEIKVQKLSLGRYMFVTKESILVP